MENLSLMNRSKEDRAGKKIIESHPYKIIHSKQIITGDEKKQKNFTNRH